MKVKGAPSLLGQDLGIVLETVRNGNASTKAVKIEKIEKSDLQRLFSGKKIVESDELTFRDLLWKIRFTTFSVFDDEIIHFSDQSKSDEKTMRFAKGTVILKKAKFPEIAKTQNIFFAAYRAE